MDHQLLTLVQSYAEEPCDIVRLFNDLYANVISQPKVIDALKIELIVAAIEVDHQRLVEYLVNSDEFAVNLNHKSDYASPSPLHAAVKIGRMDLVEILLQHGASVNLESRATLKASSEVYTAVEFALCDDKVDILSLLEPSFTHDMYTLLHIACIHGAVQCTTWLLTQPRHKATVNQHDGSPHKSTPLMIAVHHGLELTKLLLNHDATAYTISPVTHRTALHYLLSRDYLYVTKIGHFLPCDFVDILHALMIAGCDVNAVDSSGDTALSLLCMHPYTDLFIVNSSTVLIYDIQIHRQHLLDAVNLLIDYGATTNRGSINTPLDILTLFVKFIVMRKNWASRAAVITLMTSRDLLMLIGLHCDAVFSSSNPADTALILVQYMISHADRPSSYNDNDNNSDGNEDVMVVVTDICHVLMLVSSQAQLLTSAIATVEFISCLTNIYGNYHFILFLLKCYINLSRHPKAVLSDLLPLNDRLAMNEDTEDVTVQEKHAAVQLIVDLLSHPRSLKQTSRLVILSCVHPHLRLRCINGLGLPQKLVEYMYTVSS